MTTEHNRDRSILLVTDGACLGNPGPGGWGVVAHELEDGAIVSRHALAGRADGYTTNNRMELTAAYEGLRFIGGTSTPITVVSDSQYLVNGMTQWLDRWKERGWRKADRKRVENVDLWMALDELTRGRVVFWEWTRGHDDHHLNHIADALAHHAAHGEYAHDPDAVRSIHPDLFS